MNQLEEIIQNTPKMIDVDKVNERFREINGPTKREIKCLKQKIRESQDFSTTIVLLVELSRLENHLIKLLDGEGVVEASEEYQYGYLKENCAVLYLSLLDKERSRVERITSSGEGLSINNYININIEYPPKEPGEGSVRCSRFKNQIDAMTEHIVEFFNQRFDTSKFGKMRFVPWSGDFSQKLLVVDQPNGAQDYWY